MDGRRSKSVPKLSGNSERSGDEPPASESGQLHDIERNKEQPSAPLSNEALAAMAEKGAQWLARFLEVRTRVLQQLDILIDDTLGLLILAMPDPTATMAEVRPWAIQVAHYRKAGEFIFPLNITWRGIDLYNNVDPVHCVGPGVVGWPLQGRNQCCNIFAHQLLLTPSAKDELANDVFRIAYIRKAVDPDNQERGGW